MVLLFDFYFLCVCKISHFFFTFQTFLALLYCNIALHFVFTEIEGSMKKVK